VAARLSVFSVLLVAAVVFAAAGLWGRYVGPPREKFVRDVGAALEGVRSPEEAEQAIPRCGTLRFPNGEWVCGIGIDGHSMKQAKDTLVVRDSRGQVRAFVGHVCGPTYMPGYFQTVPYVKSLDDFYAHLQELGRTEYPVPAK
jgi:hypothetical protein